ncbi:MAG: PAS domain-containing sensor histidine kinase [Acidobacteriota bacterium]|nr:PAS domain-containing sensor histidine kinase [Acidobacteriota bacterium]
MPPDYDPAATADDGHWPDIARDVVTVVNADGIIVFQSPSVTGLLGYEPHEMVGQRGATFVHPDDAGPIERSMARVVAAGGLTAPVSFRMRHRDGHWVPIASQGYFFADGACGVRGVFHSRGVSPSASTAPPVDGSPTISLAALVRMNRSLAHDLRNVLTAVRGNVGLALDPDVHQPIQLLHEAILAVEYGLVLTERLRASGTPGARQAIDLNRTVDGLLPLLRRLAGPSLRIDLRPAPVGPAVLVEAGLIEQILVNLVLNARDAMPDGGLLTIRTEGPLAPSQPPDPTGSSAREAGLALLEVSDTGPGMTPEVAARVFDRFFSTSAGRGRGLGLASVARSVRANGGEIRLMTSPGQGAVFQTSLPVVSPAVTTAPAERPSAPPASSSRTQPTAATTPRE